jgi:phosphoribosyl-dephospho-CoA transferase
MNLKRHTLLDISDAGREAILADLTRQGGKNGPLRRRLERVLLPKHAGARVPGVVRREDGTSRSGYVAVGFSEPLPGNYGRFRIAALAPVKDVIKITNPYEIISHISLLRTTSTRSLAVAKDRADSLGLLLGVWGSVALELYTGLPCTSEESDLDLILAAAPLEKLHSFMGEVKIMEERFALRVDVEVDLLNGYGVQLKELLGQGRLVLGKGVAGIALLDRRRILATLSLSPSFLTDDRSSGLLLGRNS